MSAHASERHRLVVEPGGMLIGDVWFAYERIERLAYWNAIRRRNGAYLGRSFSLKLDDGDRHAWAYEETDQYDGGLAEAHDRWAVAVGVLRAAVVQRLVTRAVDTITAGGRVRFGNHVGDLRGIRALVTLAPPVRWETVVGTAQEHGVLRLFVAGRGGEGSRPRLSIAPSGWNVPLLADVVGRFGGDASRRLGSV